MYLLHSSFFTIINLFVFQFYFLLFISSTGCNPKYVFSILFVISILLKICQLLFFFFTFAHHSSLLCFIAGDKSTLMLLDPLCDIFFNVFSMIFYMHFFIAGDKKMWIFFTSFFHTFPCYIWFSNSHLIFFSNISISLLINDLFCRSGIVWITSPVPAANSGCIFEEGLLRSASASCLKIGNGIDLLCQRWNDLQ